MRATLLLSLLSLMGASLTDATPTPSANTCTKGSASNGACSFGIPAAKHQLLNNPLHVRGGELYEPENLDETDALVLNAASNGQLVVIDFTASWCGPCKMIAPHYQQMSEEIADVVFLKVDVDENAETAAKYSVSAMPTFVFIKAGEVVDRLMGANVDRLREMIEEYM